MLKQKEELAAEHAKKESVRTAAESAETASREVEMRLKQMVRLYIQPLKRHLRPPIDVVLLQQVRLDAERADLDARAAASLEAEKQLNVAKAAVCVLSSVLSLGGILVLHLYILIY